MRSYQQEVAIFALAVCACLSLAAPRSWSAEAHNLKVGVAKVDITPKDLTGITGIGPRPYAGVHDRLYARALVMDDGKVVKVTEAKAEVGSF